MAIGIELNKLMGFAINGVAIPDPSSFGYASQSVDTSAERDTKAYLHRKMVDTKYNISIGWNALDYPTAQAILAAVRTESFTLTFPCPEVPIDVNNGLYTGKYYSGDRKGDIIKAQDADKSLWIMSLSFDCIEF